MQLGDITDVGVVGAGTMGAGMAQVFAQAGYTVRWYNRSAAGLQRGAILTCRGCVSRLIRDNQSLLIRHGAAGRRRGGGGAGAAAPDRVVG